MTQLYQDIILFDSVLGVSAGLGGKRSPLDPVEQQLNSETDRNTQVTNGEVLEEGGLTNERDGLIVGDLRS